MSPPGSKATDMLRGSEMSDRPTADIEDGLGRQITAKASD
jgi:hypothetical protein